MSMKCTKWILLAMAAVLFLHQAAHGLSAPAQAQQNVLRGMVTLDRAVSQGTILLYSGAELIQSAPDTNLYNGTFSLPLNPSASTALAAGKLRITVQTNAPGDTQPITLMVDADQMSPTSRVLFVNPVTTVAADYHDLHPALSATRATRIANAALGVGSACQSTNLSTFDNPSFLAQSRVQSGFNTFAREMASGVDSGRTLELMPAVHAMATAEPRDVSSDFMTLFSSVLKSLAKTALVELPGGDAAAGWVIDEVFKAPSQSPDQLKQIETQLQDIAQQQDAILGAISNLSAQVAQNQKAILDQIKLASYQNQAQQISVPVADLCDMQSQVVFLAASDPTENHVQYAQNLQTRIQNSALNDLRQIWDGLEGDGSIASPGLITRWSDVVGPKGLPFFTDNSYLKSAVPNLQFYLGAEAIGLNLQVELGHALASQQEPSLADQIIRQSFDEIDTHVDTQFKRVAHDRKTTLTVTFCPTCGPTQNSDNYAAVVLPDAFDVWTIDTRTGLLWMRSTANCNYSAATPFSPETYYYYLQTNPPGGQQPPNTVVTCLPTINQGVAGSLAGTGYHIKFVVPSRDTWAGLIDGPRESAAAQRMTPVDWLVKNAFGLDTSTRLSYWSSDVATSDAGPMIFPNWANWVVDLRFVNPDAGQFWWQINQTTDAIAFAKLLLESDDTTENEKLFYHAGDYSVLPAGSGLQ